MTGLVGWWPLHETSGDTAYDLSGNGNHGGLVNDPIRGVAGRSGLSSYYFDGESGQYIDIGDDFPLKNLGTHGSISVWLRPAAIHDDRGNVFLATGNREPLDSAGWITSEAANFCITQMKDEKEFHLIVPTDQEGRSEVVGSVDMTYGKWQHIVVTWLESQNKVSYYRNGSLEETYHGDLYMNHFNDDDTIAENMRIGRPGDDRRRYSGNMSDFRVYNRALSPSEIKRLYRQGSQDFHKKSLSDGSDSSALSRWKLEQGGADGTTAVDSWGSNNGVIEGPAFTDDSVRNDGRALRFDGEDDYVEISPDSNMFPDVPNEISVSVWVKPNKHNERYIFESIDNDRNWVYTLRMQSDGTARFFIDTEDGRGGMNTDYIIPVDVWTHFVLNFKEGEDVKLYANGEVVASRTPDDGQLVNDFFGIVIGASRVPDRYWPGQIDDVRIFERALSSWEVFELYRWGSLGKDMRKELVNAKGNGGGQ